MKEDIFRTGIPVPLAVNIEVAHVITGDLAQFSTILVNFTPDEVLFFQGVTIVIIVGYDTVRLIIESNFTCHLVAHGSYEHAADRVVVLIPSD